MPKEEELSRLSRYEAIFELASKINTSDEISKVGGLLAGRLKYIADVFSWRYFAVGSEHIDSSSTEKRVIIIDGYRGQATIGYIQLEDLPKFEFGLWKDRKVSFLDGKTLSDAREYLPAQFQKDDINQLFVYPLFFGREIRGMFIFSKRREAFNELDIKFVTLTAQFFHEKTHMLWEQNKLRDLEKAYLQQEIMMRQSEKLATLGKLSAGMAHELNNPATAALRGSKQLNETILKLEIAQFELGEMNLSNEQRNVLETYNQLIHGKAKQPASLDPLARSDHEHEIEAWLEEKNIADPWELAAMLVNVGFNMDELSGLAQSFSPEQFPTIIASLSHVYFTHNLLEEIGQGVGRITEIVKALKSYSYLDQAPIQSIDIHEGLNNTLVMLQSELKEGIVVQREFAKNLPCIQAYGNELNQVWTNIIDNAISAMNGNGKIIIKTIQEGDWIKVQIKDTGPGIPEDIQSKIFDPFFTTKPPGDGTGLGLNISHNIIVKKHKGKISVRSVPGDTCFDVRLPLKIEEIQTKN
jgi:signal transduction histidine kinase